MSNSRGGLGTVEYVSVAGAVVGSAIAYFTNQAIFGLAPVSLSLVLNLVSRRRLEAFLDQDANVTTEVQQLRRDLTLLRTTNEKATQDIQNLVPRQELTSTVSRVEELHQQQEGLRLSLVPLQSRLDDLIQEFNNRPELEEIESLTIVIEALKQSLDQLPEYSQLPQQSTENSLAELSQNSEQVKQLQKSIELLSYQFNERPELEEIGRLSVVTQALKESLEQSLYQSSSSAREIQQQVESSMVQSSHNTDENSLAELSQNSERVEQLQKAIELLSYQFNERPELEEIGRLSVVTQALKESLEQSLYQSSSSAREIQQQVENSIVQLSHNTERVESLQKAINLLDYQIEQKIWEIRQENLAKSSD